MTDELKASVLVEHGFTGNDAIILAQCHTEGWSARWVLGTHRIKNAYKAYKILNKLCQPMK